MSQVIKYQSGGGAPTPTPGQLTFKVNGNEYKTDEQSVRDKFNDAFTGLVQKGEAHERDRADWVNSYNKIISNAKNGTYQLSSSGKSLYSEGYSGEAANQDLGLTPDGSVARKTWLGNTFARGSKNDPQRINMLEGVLGTSLIGDYHASTAKTAADAGALNAKNKQLQQDADLNSAKRWGQSYGVSTYGKNLSDDQNLVLGKWFALPKDQRANSMLASLKSKYTQIFDPKWDTDENKTLLKQNGIDIEDLRNHASPFWDKGTQNFVGKPDLLQAAEPFGTMHDDNIFMDQDAYKKSLLKPKDPNQQDGPTPGLKQQGSLFTDGKYYYKDKDKKALQTGFDQDGTLYGDDGALLTGWHNNPTNPDDQTVGWYANGKFMGKDRNENLTYGNNYMQALGKNPANQQRLSELQGQYKGIQDAYNNIINGDPNHQWLEAGKAQTNDATYNVWNSDQQHGTQKVRTRDVTAQYPGLHGNVQAYVSSDLNTYGTPNIFHMITLPNHRQYVGTIKTDVLGNVVGFQKTDGSQETDPELLKAISGVKFNQNAANPNWANTTYDPSGQINRDPALDFSHKGGLVMKQGGQIPTAQAGGSLGATSGSGNGGAHQTTTGDVSKAINDPNYHISGSDKAELAALGLNLGSLATSIFGGGGAGVAAGLGAVGTATQWGADISREGLTWGNTGSALLGLGLDAASIVPGLGVLSEGAKVSKAIARTARIAVPLLTAAGFLHGAGVFMDIATGKKGLTDLNFDDMRALTQGLTAVSGGARYATQLAGTTQGKISSIQLKNGTSVALDKPGLDAINNAVPEAKAGVIQSVLSRLTGKSGEDVQLAQKTQLQKPNSWNPLKGFGVIGQVDNTNVVSTSTGRVPLKPGELANNTWLNRFRNNSIESATTRDMNTSKPAYIVDPKYAVRGTSPETYMVEKSQPGTKPQQQWSWFGDYFGGSKREYLDLDAIGPGTTKAMADASLKVNQESLQKNQWLNDNVPGGTGQPESPNVRGISMGMNRGKYNTNDLFTNSPQGTPTNVGEVNQGSRALADAPESTERVIGGVPESRRFYGSLFGMTSLDNERTMSFTELRNRVAGLQGTKSSRQQLQSFLNHSFADGDPAKAIQQQMREALQNKDLKGSVKFKDGGKIPKFQNSGILGVSDYASKYNRWKDFTGNALSGIQTSYLPDGQSDPYGVNKWVNAVTPSDQNPQLGSTTTPIGNIDNTHGTTYVASDRNWVPDTPGSGGLHIAKPKFDISANSLSELGRAVATSNLNKSIDTRVERPMLTAPMEIPISVRGNMYAQSMANTQADNIIKNSQQFRTSDGNLQMLGNLEAQRQGAGLRMQGAMQSNQMLDQTRMQAQQNAMQNVQARTNVANENIQTLARATQAEREAENQKRAMVNQPLLDYWKDQNYKGYIQSQQNKAIDTQISGIGVENMTRSTMQQLSQAAQKVWYDTTIPEDQKMAKYMQIQNQIATLQGRITSTELQLRKDPYGTKVPGMDYFLNGLNLNGSVPSQASGGQMNVQRESIRQAGNTTRQIAKTQEDSLKDSLQDQTKRQLESMKEINSMIRLALK